MKYLGLEKVRNGRYLKNYEIKYENRAGKEKVYEIVSMNELSDISDIGTKTNGISIVATVGDKLLLLKEFRMGVGKEIINLCAGIIEKDETIEQCVKRELYEETGLSLLEIKKILPPSFAAVGISDTRTCIVFAKAEGTLETHGSPNEKITPGLYTKEEVASLLETEEFSSRSQLIAYFFATGALS